MKEKAKHHFLGKGGKRYNCAQAVIKACDGNVCVPDSLVDDFADFAGGKAPGGVCGAFYAASYLLNVRHKDKARELEKFFLENAGAVTCSGIRGGKKFSCLDCVAHSAEFLEKVMSYRK